MNYKVTLTKKQLQVVNRALETYSRLETGQFDIALSLTDLYLERVCETFSHNDFDDVIRKLSDLYGFRNGGAYGIFQQDVSQDAREAFAIQMVLRHQLWKDNPNGRAYTVDADDHVMANKEPKVVIEKIEEPKPICNVDYEIEDYLRSKGPVAWFESNELGDKVWVLAKEGDKSFWLETFDTEEEVIEFLKSEGYDLDRKSTT